MTVDIWLVKTISVRYLVIDCLALYLKGTEIFFKFAGHWLLCFFLLKTILVRFGYRLLGLIFERYWNFILSLPAIGCCAFFCWRRFQFDHWLSTAWPYIWKVLKFSYFGLKTVISFYLDSHCWPMLSEYKIFFSYFIKQCSSSIWISIISLTLVIVAYYLPISV